MMPLSAWKVEVGEGGGGDRQIPRAMVTEVPQQKELSSY